MSIELTRNFKAAITNGQHFCWNFDVSSCSIVSSSHLKHVSTVLLLKTKVWEKKFAHLSKKFASKFDAIKITAWRFSSIDYFNSAKNGMKFIYERFSNAVNLQLKHVLSKSSFCRQSAFANKKTSVTIDKSGKINKIINCDLRKIQSSKTIAHNVISIVDTDMVQYMRINVHAERLNEKNAIKCVCESLISQVTVRGKSEEFSPPKCL